MGAVHGSGLVGQCGQLEGFMGGRAGVGRESLGSTGTAMEIEGNRSGPGKSPMGSGLEMEGKPRYTHCLGPASIGSPQVPEKVT